MAVYKCPVCGFGNTDPQEDAPHLSECNGCGSEWITDTGEVILNAKTDV